MKKIVCVIPMLVAACGLAVAVDYPQWFSGRGIINSERAANDYAPVNQGQVKWMATQAYAEFQHKLPTMDLSDLEALVGSFNEANNHNPANLGMLKAVAAPFYDKLIAAGHLESYPWEGKEPADYNMANQGQLKNLFAFNLETVDADHDGLIDWWAAQYGVTDGSLDSDDDGLTNLEEFMQGSNPTLADSDGDGLSDSEEVAFGSNLLLADSDGDGLNDAAEQVNGSDPLLADTDGDGLLDGSESRFVYVQVLETYEEANRRAQQRGGHLATITSEEEHLEMLLAVGVENQASFDALIGLTDENLLGNREWVTGEAYDLSLWKEGYPNVGDLLTVYDNKNEWITRSSDTVRRFVVEYPLALDPNNPDTDGDGITDGDEVNLYHTCPFSVDTDNDGLTDLEEIQHGTDPYYADTDRDGLTDGEEIASGSDPLNPDMDEDGLKDGEEVLVSLTDPLNSDSNTNGVNDLLLIERIPGASYVDAFSPHSSSIWSIEESSAVLSSANHGPTITYTLTVTNAGIYHLGFDTAYERVPEALSVVPRLNVSIDGHDVAELVVNSSTNLPAYSVFTPWLTEGEHELHILIRKEAWSNDRFLINGIQLSSVDSNDADGNGRADWMDAQLGLTTDSDGDGLFDGEEVNVYGTDPLYADSDGDGLDDGDELAAGTDPLDSDSDDDGVSDGQEVHETMTNPLSAEFDGTKVTVQTIAGAEVVNTAGVWVAESGELVSEGRRGWMEYSVTFPEADLYCLNMTATHGWRKSCQTRTPVDTSALDVYVDGLYVGTYPVVAAEGDYVDVQAFLPVLAAGEHTVRIFWENTVKQLSLKMNQLELLSLGGPDADGNGTKDWVETSVQAMAGVERISNSEHGMMNVEGVSTFESYVSPACLEGPAHYVSLAQLEASPSSLDIPCSIFDIHQSAGARWYANLPLVEDDVTTVTASFQNGALELPIAVQWAPYNLLEHNGATIKIRKGDALRFACFDPALVDSVGESSAGGAFELRIGDELFVSTNMQPVAVTFTNVGTVNVNGLYSNAGNAISAAVNVEVIDGSFPEENPACLVGREREWNCPALPESLTLEAGPSVDLAQQSELVDIVETLADGSLVTNQASSIQLSLLASKTLGEHHVVARLYEGGPIVDSSSLNTFWVQNAVDGYFWTVEWYEESELWEVNMITKNVPESVEVNIHVFAGGVTFDDYTIDRTITATDMNEVGEYDFRLYHPNERDGSTCHTVRLYQDGVFIGEGF